MSDTKLSDVERARSDRAVATALKLLDRIAVRYQQATAAVELGDHSTDYAAIMADEVIEILNRHTAIEIEHDKLRRGVGGSWK